MSISLSTRTLGLTTPLAISGRKIRVAVVGCGRISKSHFSSIKAHRDEIELVGVCDTEPKRVEEAALANGAPGYTALADLLAGSEADVVVLTTPSGLHAR